MLRLAEILCSVLAIGSLVVQIDGSSDPTGDLILDRLDLARLSQLRVELRKLDPVRKCGVLQQELNGMFNGVVSSQQPNGVFTALASVLRQRKLPFGNNQPVLEDIQMCIGLAESGALVPTAQNLPIQREVIRGPPPREPLQPTPVNPIHNAMNEFHAVQDRVRDVGQDLYRTAPGQSYPSGIPAMDHASQAINRNINRLGDAIQDIVEDAADGRLDGVKNYPPGGYHMNPHAREANYRLKNEMGAIAHDVKELVEDAADGRLDGIKGGHLPYGAVPNDGSYSNHYSNHHLDAPVSDYQRDVAQRAIERGMDKLKDKLNDVVEDAADGRLDGRKDYVGGYKNAALEHAQDVIRDGVHNIEHNMRNIVEDASDGRLDGYSHGHSLDHSYSMDQSRGLAHGGGYVDPHYEEMRHQEEALHAKKKIERQVDHLEHQLKDVVEDAADGRIDGIKGGYQHVSYPPPGVSSIHSDYHQQQAAIEAKRAIEGQMDHLEHHLKDIVEDASDGHVDGVKGNLPPYNPYSPHLQGPYANVPHYDPNHRAYLQERQHEANRRLEKTVDRIGDAIEDAAHLGNHPHGYNPHLGGTYANDLHHQHGMDQANRVISNQINHIEDRLQDIVEDAADGRIDGIKGHVGPGFHVHSNLPHQYQPEGYLSGGSYHQQRSLHDHHAGPIDPRSLPSHNEMVHARRKVENRIDDLQDKLHDIVEDASDGRIDGIKSRMGFPDSRHRHRHGHGYPYSGQSHGDYHSRGGSFSRMLGKGLDKIGEKLQRTNIQGQVVGANGYDSAEMLRELHQLMSFNPNESPLMRCDRFSTLLGSSPMSREQVAIIARQPITKLATGRPIAESRPVIQSMLLEYGNLFISSPDSIARALGDELIGCANMASSSQYHHNHNHHRQQHGGYIPGGYSGMGANGSYRPHRGVKKLRSKLGMVPFEAQLNSRFPTMPAMPTIHY